MSKVERFEDLQCWKEARVLANMIYSLCSNGKFSKDFGFQDQIKRASISVMNNIAEGFSRYSRKEFIRYLNISQSSASEVKSMLYVIEDLNYEAKDKLQNIHDQIDKTRNLILAFIKYLNKPMTKFEDKHPNTTT